MSATTIRKHLTGLAYAVLFAGLLGASFGTKLYADEWNKMTKFTFTEAVQIPGMVLEPGTYTFKLLDSSSDRHIVQIRDANDQKLFATVLAIPDYRLEAKGHTVLRFDERLSDQPQAVKEWFYPGDNAGQEFVYPKDQSLKITAWMNANRPTLAQNVAPAITPEPVPEVQTETTPAPEPTPAPEVAPAPSAPDTEIEPEQQTPATPDQSQTDKDKTSTTPSDTDQSQKLPKTAGELPLIFAIGSSAFGIGAMLRSYRRRSK